MDRDRITPAPQAGGRRRGRARRSLPERGAARQPAARMHHRGNGRTCGSAPGSDAGADWGGTPRCGVTDAEGTPGWRAVSMATGGLVGAGGTEARRSGGVAVLAVVAVTSVPTPAATAHRWSVARWRMPGGVDQACCRSGGSSGSVSEQIKRHRWPAGDAQRRRPGSRQAHRLPGGAGGKAYWRQRRAQAATNGAGGLGGVGGSRWSGRIGSTPTVHPARLVHRRYRWSAAGGGGIGRWW